MFEKILIAYRGDQLPDGSAAAKPICLVATSHQGNFVTEPRYV